MNLRIVSLRHLLPVTVVTIVLLAGVVACDSPFTISIPGVGDVGVVDDDSNTNDNGSEDGVNIDEPDDDSVNDEDGALDDDDERDDDSADDSEQADDDDTDRGSLIGDADSGGELFATNCAVCHGDDATGVVGPNIQGEDFGEIYEHAIEGHEEHTMFELLDQDVADIEAFLATLGG